MARLRREAAPISESAAVTVQSRGPSEQTALDTDSPGARPARRRAAVKYTIPDDSDEEEPVTRVKPRSQQNVQPATRTKKTQIRLTPLQSLGSLSDLTIQDDSPEKTRRRSPLKQSSRQLLRKQESKSGLSLSPERSQASQPDGGLLVQNDVPDQEDAPEGEVDIEESIWCGSDTEGSSSEDELPSPSTFFPTTRKQIEHEQPDLATQLEALSIFDRDAPPLPAPRHTTIKKPRAVISLASLSDKENQDAITRPSPPRRKKPVMREVLERPSTPPPSPPRSPSKLKSPSKRAPRVPTPPGRPSLEAFWTADTVNDWNDQYSPQKPLRSPTKLFNNNISPIKNTFDDTPIPSPAKLRSSPTKRSRAAAAAELQARKDWDTRKVLLAESFLLELDQSLTQGQIARLAASTGGVKIIWSKTLNSTAGRANWRRETTKSHSRSDPSKPPLIEHKHFASIELAEKVLTYTPPPPTPPTDDDDDDENYQQQQDPNETKLLNILAHEFCHLANFMISQISTHPHGASFRAWGTKCSALFGATRGIQVTTKHSYEIDYKFVWRCVSNLRDDGREGQGEGKEEGGCGTEYKRHSRSVDPKRHRCGRCKGVLVQVKPVPRGGGGGGGGSNSSAVTVTAAKSGGVGGGFAGFVKIHFAEMKKSFPPGASHKEVMEALGKKYRAEKAEKKAGGGGGGDYEEMEKKLKNVKVTTTTVIDEEEEEEEEREEEKEVIQLD